MVVHKWWHVFIRKRMKPIHVDKAILWKRRLSLLYGIFAWNAFGLVIYSAYNGKADWAHYYGIKTDEEKELSPGHAWANTLGIKNAKVYRISGFQKVNEYEIVDGIEVRPDETQNKEEQEEHT